MSLKKDIIEAEFRTTGANKLHHEIGKTEGEIKRLNKENERLRINKTKLEAQGKKNTKAWKDLNKQIKQNNEAIRTEKQRLQELNGKLKITEMSAKQLSKRKRELTRELNATSKAVNPKKWNQLNSELKKVNTQYKKVRAGGKGVNGVLKKMGALLPVVGIAALVAGFKKLVSKIIEVRKEFEKYEAILKVALGSQKAAQKEMKMLQQFAAETPFQLEGLTGAFVKLVNQGFKPSREEMRKLGDLAASMGKDFDQLTEAIIDAQTGEFERLKEFGIRASKQGDQVKFTFKGIETQVAFTADSIREYILGLGEMEGISGSMAEISGTLGGRISNLKDAWDRFLNILGKRSSGVFINIINLAIDLVEALTWLSKGIKELREEMMDKFTAENLQKALVEIEVITQSLVKNGIKQEEAQKRAVELYTESVENRIKENRKALETASADEKEFIQMKIDQLVNEREALKDHFYEVAQLERKQQEAKLAQLEEEQKKKREAEQKRREEEAQQREKAKNALLTELELLYQEELSLLKQKLLNQEITQQEYEDRLLEMKIKYLEAEKEIRRQAGEEIVSIDNRILDLEIQIMEKKQAEADRIRDEEKEAEKKAAQERKEQAEKELKEHEALLKKREDQYYEFAGKMSQAMTSAFEEGEFNMREFLKSSLLALLDYLHKYVIAKIAQIWVEGVATAPAGLVKAAILTALVEGVYQTAKAALTRSSSSESSQYFSGGPTGLGDKYEPAGVVHKNEYVIPEEGMFNPNLRPFINLIEAARQAGTLRSLNMQNVSVRETDKLAPRGFAKGGPTTTVNIPEASSMDPALIELIESTIELLQQLKEEGVVAYIGDRQVREIRNRTRIIEDIENSVSR